MDELKEAMSRLAAMSTDISQANLSSLGMAASISKHLRETTVASKIGLGPKEMVELEQYMVIAQSDANRLYEGLCNISHMLSLGVA